jgi:uncharacterized glyoxalase superfamily metalloenzyme YdcJ
MLTALLAVQDRRYFDDDLAERLHRFLGQRQLFSPRLLELAARAEAEGGLDGELGEEFVRLATSAFRLSREPIDARWYAELEAVSSVAADIGGVPRTHINHLTPRVLDIDVLYRRMVDQGVRMIDEVQGPPSGPWADVLLRQTSFRALAEARKFRDTDGRVYDGHLRVRFGEVESRGIALTAAGLERYASALLDADGRRADEPDSRPGEALADVWKEHFPSTTDELFGEGLAPFVLRPVVDRPLDGKRPTSDVAQLLDDGFAEVQPMTYEDFLPRSAAGIFASNLTSDTRVNADGRGCELDHGWLSEALQREVHDPTRRYEEAQEASVHSTLAALAISTSTRSGAEA